MAPDAKVPLLEGRGSGATPAQTLGNIVVSIVGTGVLGLPYAFRTAGWLAGALGVAGAGAATFYCMLLLLDCRDKLREQEETEEEEEGRVQETEHGGANYTYGDLGERCFGPTGRYFTESIIILCQTGGTVAYLVFIGQNISSVLPAVSPATVVLALLLPAQVALSFVRSLSALAPFSLLADACTVLAVAAVVKEYVRLLVERGEQPFEGRSAFAGLWGVPFACGVAVFCFEGFCLTLALEASMADRGRFRSVLLQAIAGVTVVYVGFGVCGYLAYGDATRDIVTLNLPSNWSTAAVKVVLCVALALTFAVMMHPIHEIVEARLFGPDGWVWRRHRRAGRAPPQPRGGGGGAGRDSVLRAGVRGVRGLRREHGVRAALLRAAGDVPPPRRGADGGPVGARRGLLFLALRAGVRRAWHVHGLVTTMTSPHRHQFFTHTKKNIVNFLPDATLHEVVQRNGDTTQKFMTSCSCEKRDFSPRNNTVI